MSGGIYVPTDRPCPTAIDQAVAECAHLRDHSGTGYTFVLVEHADTSFVRAHADRLAIAADRHRVPVLHLTTPVWSVVLGRVLDEAGLTGAERVRLTDLLSPVEPAYGAGPNKAFLIAAALGIEILHRRDSDQEVDRRAGQPVFPGALELEAVTGTVGELTGNASTMDSDVPAFAGSTLFGDPAHDRRDLASDLEAMISMEELNSDGLTREELVKIIQNYHVDERTTRHETDYFELDHYGARTEAGVSCVRRLFRSLPESPMRKTLSTDYTQRNLLLATGRPVVFHSRKMRHVYRSERAGQTNVDAAVSYGLKDLRAVLVQQVNRRLSQAISAAPDRFLSPDLRVDAVAYADAMEAAYREARPRMDEFVTRFATAHDGAAFRATGQRAQRLLSIAKAADTRRESLLEDVERGIADFSLLLRRWRDLVDASTGLGAELAGFIRNPDSA